LFVIGYYVSESYSKLVQNKILANGREHFLRTFYRRRYKDTQNKHSAELMTLMTEDVTNIMFAVNYIVIYLSYSLLLLFGAIIMMFLINWVLASAITITVPLMMFLINAFTPAIERSSKNFLEAEQDVRKNLQEGFFNIFLFRAFSMIGRVAAKNTALHNERGKRRLKQEKIVSTQSNIRFIYMTAMEFGIFALGGFFVMNNSISIGEVLGIVALRGLIDQPLSTIAGVMPLMAQARAGYSRIQEVEGLPEEKIHDDTKIDKAEKLLVENFSFSYDDDYSNENAVLRNVNLTFEAGKVIGIKGESGSGKSTLIQTIMGFYSPNHGTIKLVDESGQSSQNITPYVAYVPPANYVFNGTLAENIYMISEFEQDKMEKAAKAAGIYDFIMTLPEGFETVIGEGATELSSGQGQRVAIARALYQDSPVMIFDEPTSNLDSESVTVVHEAIRRAAQDKICLVISHDAATIDICDELYLVENQGVAKA